MPRGDIGSTKGLVALTSGGIDSTVMAFVLQGRGYKVVPLFIDYGQTAAVRELAALRRVLPPLLRDYLSVVRMSGVKDTTDSRLVGGMEPDFWMPHRNLLLLTVAAMRAQNLGFANVAIGIIGEASVRVPDADLAFVRLAAKTISKSAGSTLRIIAPLRELTKADVIRLAAEYAVPLGETWSCFLGGMRPCGQCPACKQYEVAKRVAES